MHHCCNRKLIPSLLFDHGALILTHIPDRSSCNRNQMMPHRNTLPTIKPPNKISAAPRPACTVRPTVQLNTPHSTFTSPKRSSVDTKTHQPNLFTFSFVTLHSLSHSWTRTTPERTFPNAQTGFLVQIFFFSCSSLPFNTCFFLTIPMILDTQSPFVFFLACFLMSLNLCCLSHSPLFSLQPVFQPFWFFSPCILAYSLHKGSGRLKRK